MAPLPQNATDVFFLDYTTGRREHTLQVRTNAAVPGAEQAVVFNFLQALQQVLPQAWTVLGGRRRAAGSDITLPVPLLEDLATFNGDALGTLPEEEEPREFVWVGRGPATGRRFELSLYGVIINTPPSYRYPTEGGPPSLAAARQQLVNNEFTPITIGGDKPTIYTYVNVNYNSYWEGRSRRG